MRCRIGMAANVVALMTQAKAEGVVLQSATCKTLDVLRKLESRNERI